MKKVIVATNFSEEAENATIYAAQAAAALNLELVLFNLHNVSIHALNARTSSNSMNHGLALAKLELAEAAQKLEKEYQIKVTPHIASGDITDELNRCFVTHDADMLVLGMPEKSVEQDLLGNTTTLVINKIKYPIMAIPKSVKFEGIKKILFACDVTKGVHGIILERVKSVARSFGAKVEVFYVCRKQHELSAVDTVHLDSIYAGLDGIDYSYNNVTSDSVVESIKDEIKETSSDLLVMVPYKYGFLSSMVHRSKTRMMASESNVPLLSLNL